MLKNKRGISAIIGYVLLISITLSLSVLVYNWLRFYVSTDNMPQECSDKVNIVINSYNCTSRRIDQDSGAVTNIGGITLTLKNKGLFSIDGYKIRFHTNPNAKFGIYDLNRTGIPLRPGETSTYTYSFDNIIDTSAPDPLASIKLIDVQPFVNNEDGNVSCTSFVTQKILCK